MRLLSLFSGIGAFEKALDRENIPYELVNFCEIDKFAVKSYCAIHGVTEDKNLGDISKVADEDIPDCDLISYGYPCVTGDTLIATAGGYKQIKEIKEGEMVLTHANEYKKVERFIPQGKKEIWHINAMGTHGIDTTENHRYYARKKYRKGHLGIRTFTEPAWVECKNLNNNYYLGTPVNNNNIPFEDSSIDLDFTDDTLWYLAGRYLGDGWTRERKDRATNVCGVVICCGKHKANDFEKKIDNKYHYTKSETRTTINYIFSSIAMAKLFSMMGHGAANKEIPPCFIDMPVEYLRKVMEGYFDSDGAKTQGLYKITTVSSKLVYSAAQAISKVYHRPVSVYTTKRPSTCVIEGRIVNQRDTYQLTFKPNANKQDKAFYEDGYIWFPIRSVTNTHEMKDVYDITVEAHHSFVANNCMAHNCQDISVAGKMAGIVEGETRSGLLFEALRIIKNKNPKYAIAENVKNLVGKKFKADFDNMLNILDSYGYNSYWQVLNAKDYGIPQNRERVFVISIRKDIDNGTFKFPEKFPLELRLKDMLEGDVDDKFYLTPKQIKCLNVNEPKGTDIIHVGNTKSGGQKPDIILADEISSCLNATGYKQPKQIVDNPAYESVTQVNDNYAMLNGGKIGKMTDIYRRAYYEDGVSPTIHTCPGGNTEPKVILLDDTQGFDGTRAYKDYSPTLRAARSGLKVATDFRIRKLTPKECWRLMGFDDSDFDKAKYRTEIKYLRGDEKCGANLKAVSEKPKPNDMATYVLCTTKDLKDMEILKTIKKSSAEMPEQEKMQNVNFVIEKLAEMECLECATNTTRCIDFMGTHFILMEGLDRQTTDIIAVVKKGKGNTAKYMKITTVYNLPVTKLYTILTLFVQIMQSKIFISTTVKANIQGNIVVTENSENNFLMQLSNLKMESIIEQMSNSALYKQAGNSIVVNVLQYIFRNLFKGGVTNEA